jgi:hypothetical protein
MKALKPHRNEADIIKAVRSGASAYAIAAHFQLTVEDAAGYIDSVAREIKQSGFSHRVNLRALIREQASSATKTLRDVMDNRDGILNTPAGCTQAIIRMKAADALLKHAVRFIDEDVVRGFVEQPELPVQQTLFDFDAEIDDGAVKLIAREHLRLVAGDE